MDMHEIRHRNASSSVDDWLKTTEKKKLTLRAYVEPYTPFRVAAHVDPAVVAAGFAERDANEPSLSRNEFSGALGVVALPQSDEELEARVDRQLEADIEAGKFEELAQRALEAYRKGEVTEL